MTYADEFQQLLQTHFDADDIPCDEFTAIRDAYLADQSLTASAVRLSIASVIDEEESGPLPEALISGVVAWLAARVPVNVPVKKSAVKKVPVDKGVKAVSKTVKKTGVAGATPTAAPSVIPVNPAVIPSVIPAVTPAVTPAVIPAVLPAVPPSDIPAEVPTEKPIKPMNHVARFSQMVSYTCNPGVYATAMEALLNTPVQLLDGFKRDSPLYAMLETTDLLSRIGTRMAFRELTAEIKSKIPKPAVVTIAAIVRWFLSTEAREGLTAAFVALALPIPVKVRSAKPSKRRAKSPAAGDASTASVGGASSAAVTPSSAGIKRVKRVKRDPSERRPAKGYSLFTQRIGGVMKGAEGAYGSNVVTISDNFSEATKAKPVGGYQKFTSLLASGTLKAGESYTVANLCGVTREEKSPVVSVSGLIWGMCDATTRLRLGGESLPPSPPS